MSDYAINGKVQTAEPDWTGVPTSLVGRMSAVCHSLKDCQDLVHFFDNQPDFCPNLPVLLMIPGVWPPVPVVGLGYATAAELRDTCVDAWCVKSGRAAKDQLAYFDDQRERNGLMERSKVAEMTQYAFWDRTKRHKASPVTDPVKQFRYFNPKHRVVFHMDGLRRDN